MRSVLYRAGGILLSEREWLRVRVPARGMFWWGHDTIEDQAERRKEANAKGVIAWTDPEKAMEEKKEFVWSPQRIEDEAKLSTNVKGSERLYNPADFVHWINNKVFKPYLPQIVLDPIWFMQETKRRQYRGLVRSQIFVRERLVALGPDLAAAHFLCHRNCRVRFRGHKHWTQLGDDKSLDIPAIYVAGWHIEAIDAAQSLLVYEGLQNFRNLHYVKYLDLSYCDYIDEWCMDRITGEFHHSLEYLNISGCTKVNWNAMEVIWRCSNLKTLVIKDMDHVQDLTLICLMLLEVLPNLNIQGADYMETSLLEGTQHEYLLEEDFVPRIPAGESKGVEEENGDRRDDEIESKETEKLEQKSAAN